MTIRRWTTVLLALGLMMLAIAASAFSIREEIKLGNDSAKEVEKEAPVVKNEQWQSDIDAMGKRFMPFIQRKEIPYTFRIVDAKDQINAFALPGGHIYFTERMWKMMTPDERAAIMAHEITHCDKRHGIDQMLKSQQRFLWMLPLIILTGGEGANAIMMGEYAITQRYSRDMERVADKSGIALLAEAGYNPGAMVTSMKKLLNMETGINRYEISSVFASHPETRKRIEYLTEAATKLGVKPSDMNLKAVDDPSRLGNIIALRAETNLASARTSTPLTFGQKVTIKKLLWDDYTQSLRPKTICHATVLTPGNLPILAIKSDSSFSLNEVMEGDGVYPDEGEPAKAAESPAKGS